MIHHATARTIRSRVAPLIVKDKVIVGTAGGDGPIRGFLAAFDAKTGKEVWRFYTIPGPGEPGNETWSGESWKIGGAGIWTTGSYDAETNLTFWGIGNPAPDTNGNVRLGDNLYTDCVIALDADTGKLKWYYQFTPHDEMDYDSTQVPVLADIEVKGRMRKVMMLANRNGVMYVLDRTTGEFLQGKPFVKVNWMDGFDAKGRPHARSRQSSCRQRRRWHAHHADRARRNQLVSAVVQPEDRPVLCLRMGELESPAEAAAARRRNTTPMADIGAGAKHQDRRGRLRRRAGIRSEDPRSEVGIQDERHHLGRSALDRGRRRVQRRTRRLLLRARRPHAERCSGRSLLAARSTAAR